MLRCDLGPPMQLVSGDPIGSQVCFLLSKAETSELAQVPPTLLSHPVKVGRETWPWSDIHIQGDPISPGAPKLLPPQVPYPTREGRLLGACWPLHPALRLL